MSFKENVLNSLCEYRSEKLNIKELGVFKYREQELLKEHILPVKFRTYNILENYRESFFSSPNSKIDFHKYFHHLNSSQALCINLFFPLILDEKLYLILDLLGIPGQSITEVAFEKESELESGAGRKTNFDFYILLADDTKVYFEIKYTESEFGKAKDDDEHRAKYEKTYLPLLRNNDYIKREFSDVDEFLKSYQIMRNLCHINENSFVVFVYPEANKKIHIQAQTAKESILTNKGNKKFRILTLESTIEQIIDMVDETRLKTHYQEFKLKYLSYNEI